MIPAYRRYQSMVQVPKGATFLEVKDDSPNFIGMLACIRVFFIRRLNVRKVALYANLPLSRTRGLGI